MLLENSLFGTIDKVAAAIELLQKHEPPEGYYVAFSGGKDSVVILDLVKRAGVKFEAHHHIMTIEPPELMQFIFKQYPEVINDHPPKTMHQLIVQYGFPPLRIVRYCCWELKANNGNNKIKVTGVRAEESPRRAKYPKVEIKENSGELRLIHDWTAAEVWEYIHARNLPYCKLYDEWKKRIGCVFCPFARERENIENAVKYPQFVRYFITACDRAIKNRLAKGKDSKYKTGAEMFIAWIEGGRGKKLKDFGVKFDFEKGEIVMENNIETVISTTAVVPAESETSVANMIAENSNAVVPALTLEQRVIKIQFHLQNMGQSAIIIGQELIECKKEVGHGNWTIWLKDNFNLSQDTATNFMKIAERFSNSESIRNLGVTQMIQLLKLPAGDEEKFIAEKAAEGTPVEDMTVKKLREEIKKYKAETEKKDAKIKDLQIKNRNLDNNCKFANNQVIVLAKENEELKKDNELKLDVNRSNAEEYFRMKAEKEQEIADLNAKINELQKQLENPTVEVLPADDEEKENLRKELATFKAREQNFREEIATSQALNQFFMMANFLHEHQDCLPEVLKGYVHSDPLTPQRITQIKKIISNFDKILAKFSN